MGVEDESGAGWDDTGNSRLLGPAPPSFPGTPGVDAGPGRGWRRGRRRGSTGRGGGRRRSPGGSYEV